MFLKFSAAREAALPLLNGMVIELYLINNTDFRIEAEYVSRTLGLRGSGISSERPRSVEGTSIAGFDEKSLNDVPPFFIWGIP